MGTYGSYVYILCGMRAPSSLYGGKGWPIDFSAATGDPQETGRAWQSTAPAEHDRSVLLEPNGLKRTPASFDDHGEVRPIGKGPDLHLRLPVPEGKYLLSLYFFEIDWIQYRAYRIKIFASGQEDNPLVTSEVRNFFKGKYSRYVVIGPADLLIVVERGQSPNAELSGIFLDELQFPDLYMLQRTSDLRMVADVPTSASPERAGQAAEEALRSLTEAPQDSGRQTQYVKSEIGFFEALRTQESASPEDYYRSLEQTWAPAEGRMARALGVLAKSPYCSHMNLLRYYAARARCDFEGARQNAEALADYLLERSLAAQQPWLGDARFLREYAADLLEEGRRGEAVPFVHAYLTFCLEKESPERSKENLLFIGDLALKAGVPAPAAAALSEWQAKHGTLSTKERLLLGSLYYVGGDNGKAFEVLKSVEPELRDAVQHKWCLIVMLTALLRLDRMAEAQALMQKLEESYPDQPELDEVRYRLGAHYFEKRKLELARKCFESLRDSTQSALYQEMCDEYIGRISHLESLEEQRDE